MLNTANVITSLRILFALGMLLAPPFSAAFWICYVCGGLSDIFDGLAARRLHQQTEFGAKLDSAADAVFAFSIAAVITLNVRFPAWLWGCVIIIALLRFASYVAGYVKYKTFAPLHTLANKATGALIFAFPLLYALLGLTVSGVLLCAAAFLSSAEELAITLASKTLDRDVKGLFFK